MNQLEIAKNRHPGWYVMLMDATDLGKCYRRFGGRMNFYMYKRRKNILDR